MMRDAAGLSGAVDSVAATPSHRRLTFLDAVRGIAAIAVVAQHYGTNSINGFEELSRTKFDIGQFGVVAFFLVSGFIIPVSLEKYGRLGAFWKARIFRLYPMYWLSLVVTLALGWWGLIALEPLFHVHPALAVAADVTMLQRFMGLPDAEGVYWTLALEMIFYVLCSVMVVAGCGRRAAGAAVVGALSVAAINNGMAFGLHRSPPAMHLALLMTALVGSVAYRVYSGEVAARSLQWLLPLTGVVAIEGFWLHYVHNPAAGKIPIPLGSMWWSWSAAYLLFFGMFWMRAKQFPGWLQWLGRISYSLYLMHLPVWSLLPAHYGPWVRIPVATAVVLGLSHMTYEYVERPAIKLGR